MFGGWFKRTRSDGVRHTTPCASRGGDEMIGSYTRERLERMDQHFVSAVERAFRTGVESRRAAAVTYDLTKR
jgi:hypothetical protein